MDTQAVIFILGALVFGLVYPFFKPYLDWPWVAVLAVAYFAGLRLLGHFIARTNRRRAGR
ncbi:hypothetical protein [Pseudoxanthomonas japonensis]|uniref:hypothetical protein n=1 Tax=Pseudoxanthomonas japonensis TaxID=69284 RepID=UPI00286BCAE6|nr:hypothetical protein [Pseudoxanthomonas japonensis]